MSDLATWDRAVGAVMEEYGKLHPVKAGRLKVCAEAIRECKRLLHCVSLQAECEAVCANCRGECCETGVYHFTVVDLLVFLASGRMLFTPRFRGKGCPYLAESGCVMEPDFRPFNCITFNCERVEGLLDPGMVARFYLLERKLRSLYTEMEELFRNRFMQGLLMNYERDVMRNGAPILRASKLAPGPQGG